MSVTFRINYHHIIYHVRRGSINGPEAARLHAYMAQVLRAMRVSNPIVGGVNDHIHFIGNFPIDVSLLSVVKKIKNESAEWLRRQDASYARFCWQRGFTCISVSPGHVARVENYICNQPIHHRQKSFGEEIASIAQALSKDGLE